MLAVIEIRLHSKIQTTIMCLFVFFSVDMKVKCITEFRAVPLNTHVTHRDRWRLGDQSEQYQGTQYTWPLSCWVPRWSGEGCCGAPLSLSPALCPSDCPSCDGYILNTIREHSKGRYLLYVWVCHVHQSLENLSAPCHTSYEISLTKEGFQELQDVLQNA